MVHSTAPCTLNFKIDTVLADLLVRILIFDMLLEMSSVRRSGHKRVVNTFGNLPVAVDAARPKDNFEGQRRVIVADQRQIPGLYGFDIHFYHVRSPFRSGLGSLGRPDRFQLVEFFEQDIASRDVSTVRKF